MRRASWPVVLAFGVLAAVTGWLMLDAGGSPARVLAPPAPQVLDAGGGALAPAVASERVPVPDLRPRAPVDAPSGTPRGSGTLATGCIVRGRITDTEGSSLARVGLHTLTSGDGRIELQGRIEPGRWRIIVKNVDLLDDPRFDVAPGQRYCDRVLRVLGPSERPGLRGVVVDESELPLAGITVHGGPLVFSLAKATTAADGGFDLSSRDRTRPEQVKLHLLRDRTPAPDSPYEVAWSDEPLRLVSRRAIRVEVAVRHAFTGAPIRAAAVGDHGVDAAVHSREQPRAGRRRVDANHSRGELQRQPAEARGAPARRRTPCAVPEPPRAALMPRFSLDAVPLTTASMTPLSPEKT